MSNEMRTPPERRRSGEHVWVVTQHVEGPGRREVVAVCRAARLAYEIADTVHRGEVMAYPLDIAAANRS